MTEGWKNEVVESLRVVADGCEPETTSERALLGRLVDGLERGRIDGARSLLEAYERTDATGVLDVPTVHRLLSADAVAEDRPAVLVAALAAALATTLVDRSTSMVDVERPRERLGAVAEEPTDAPETLAEVATALATRTRLDRSARAVLELAGETSFARPGDERRVADTVESALAATDLRSLAAVAAELRRVTDATWSRSDLLRFDGLGFERLVADLYEAYGYETRLTRASRDMGIDVVVESDGRRGLVQAKRYEGRKVTGPELSKYVALLSLFDATDFVVVATTSTFTEQARQRRDLVADCVRLLDGEQLVTLLSGTELVPPLQL